ALLHVRPLGFTDFIASAGTAQWGQVKSPLDIGAHGASVMGGSKSIKTVSIWSDIATVLQGALACSRPS
ncbi:hypothetical protein VDS34_22415, partial [Xanthomonas campestris pv. campestris]|nr:hypothetical protein [Xanthomonas campestris pv. campestris]